MRFRLLRCLARAIVKNGLKLACNLVPGVGAVYEVAADTWEEFNKDQRDDSLRAEVQELAQAPLEQVRQDVQQAVEAEAAGQPEQVRQALAAYLTQVPAAIRRSLRRPSDPKGTTVPPTLAFSRPEDLMTMLPPRPPRFKPGDRPQGVGDWELEELLGMGGFGEVWRARHAHMRSKAPVALKFCLEQAAVAALRNEVGVLDRVMQHGRHQGIVPLLQTYLSANPPCLEYELVEGGDLAGLIQELHGRKQMTVDLANRFFLSLVEIVAHAHRGGIVHGDLKPANVLVRRGADGKVGLRVTDFGIGGLTAALAIRETHQPTRSRPELVTEAVRGAYTPLYAAPEQMVRRKGESADPRDDVHALGVIWYQLLTGDLGMMSVPPDWRDSVEERGLDAELIRLLGACMAARADKRPANAVVVGERLRAALPGKAKAEQQLREKEESKLRLNEESVRKVEKEPKQLREEETRRKKEAEQERQERKENDQRQKEALVPQAKKEEMQPQNSCSKCGDALEERDDYCKNCGTIFWNEMGCGLGTGLIFFSAGSLGLYVSEWFVWRLFSWASFALGSVCLAIYVCFLLHALILQGSLNEESVRKVEEEPKQLREEETRRKKEAEQERQERKENDQRQKKALVPQAKKEEMQQPQNSCSKCGDALEERDQYCKNCGTIFWNEVGCLLGAGLIPFSAGSLGLYVSEWFVWRLFSWASFALGSLYLAIFVCVLLHALILQGRWRT